MPLTHTRAFRVHYLECDTYGRVHPAAYMRYAQESATDAAAAAGYDQKRHEELDRTWLIRETDIEYLHPLHYGDSVQVKTWVVDFRRVRSVRAYEFRNVGSGELVARAFTDWVHLELSTGKPVAIAPEMKAAFFPEGPPPPAPARARFPAAPAQPPGAFRQRRRAEWRDIDPVGHVNNAVYLTYIQDGALQSLASLGWPVSRMEAEGVAIATRSHRIEYRQPTPLDDELEIITWLSDLGDATVVRHTVITRPGDGAKITRARTVHAWVNTETGTPVAIPSSLAADLAHCVAG